MSELQEIKDQKDQWMRNYARGEEELIPVYPVLNALADVIEQLEQAQTDNQKLVECLEWYANKNLYFRTEHNMASIDFDEGHKARQILGEVKGNGSSKET